MARYWNPPTLTKKRKIKIIQEKKKIRKNNLGIGIKLDNERIYFSMGLKDETSCYS